MESVTTWQLRLTIDKSRETLSCAKKKLRVQSWCYVWNHTWVRGWDRWITARRAQHGGLWFTVSNPSTSALIAFLTCTNSGSKCNNLRESKLQLKSRPCRFGLFLFCSCVSNENQGPNARASFAKQNSASVMMLTSRLRVEVCRCSNAIQADTLVPVCLPALPTAVDANKSTRPELRRFSAVSLPSGWPIVSPRQSSKRKKERKNVLNTNPLVCSFMVIDSSEHDRPTVLRHCQKSQLNLACFAASPSCSRLIYTRSSADSRSSLTKSLAQPLPLRATCTCSCHMRVVIQTLRTSLRYLVTPKMVLATPIMAKRVSSNQNLNFTRFLSYLGTPKMVLRHIKYGKAGCDRDITPRLGVCDRDITTLSAHALIGHCLGNSHVTCQNTCS